MNIFDRVKSLTEKRNITIADLERALSLSNGSIAKWKTSVPKADTLYRVAGALGTSTDFLIEGNEHIWDEKGITDTSKQDFFNIFKKVYGEASLLNDTDMKLISNIMVELFCCIKTKYSSEYIELAEFLIVSTVEFSNQCVMTVDKNVEKGKLKLKKEALFDDIKDFINETLVKLTGE